jgi:hypothetical protein
MAVNNLLIVSKGRLDTRSHPFLEEILATKRLESTSTGSQKLQYIRTSPS